MYIFVIVLLLEQMDRRQMVCKERKKKGDLQMEEEKISGLQREKEARNGLQTEEGDINGLQKEKKSKKWFAKGRKK